MKGVSLVSGGLDSTLMAVLLRDQGFDQVPLFMDYGQLAAKMEWETCNRNFTELNLPSPIRLDLNGFGKLIKSGITDSSKDIIKDAFLPGRNLLFLVAGASLAVQTKGSFISIGLLGETFALFPDQNQQFLDSVERTIEAALGMKIKVLAPLFDFSKVDVIVLARQQGIDIGKMYSCHKGGKEHCGSCISCKERIDAMKILEQLGEGGV
jgi:7-cyano-7-deazaguanine synthase